MSPKDELNRIRWVCGWDAAPEVTEELLDWLRFFPVLIDTRTDFIYDRCIGEGVLLDLVPEIEDPELAFALMTFHGRLCAFGQLRSGKGLPDAEEEEAYPPRTAVREQPDLELGYDTDVPYSHVQDVPDSRPADPVRDIMEQLGYDPNNVNTTPDQLYDYLKERIDRAGMTTAGADAPQP